MKITNSVAIRYSALATLIFVFFTLFSLAQSPAPSAPDFGSYGGGPDVVDLANANAHWSIPVISKPGRGMNFSYVISYDTSVWSIVTSGTTSWQPVFNWGWTGQTAIKTGYISYTRLSQLCDVQGPPFPSYYFFENFVYHDPWGGAHPFSGMMEYDPNNCDLGTTSSMTSQASDGSAYTISATINTAPTVNSATITTPSGKVSTPPLNANSGSSTATDRNGNQITSDGTGHFYDTLSGTTAVLTYAGSGTPASPMTFTYTAPSGGSASYTMKFTTYSVRTNFGCSGISDFGTNGTTTANLVSEIDLPDGSKYSFAYEPTPGHSGFVTGRLASVTVPTGGTISYSYSGGSSGHITCADGSTPTLTRTTPDGAWTYARSQVSGTHWQTKVTSPNSDDTVIDFQQNGSGTSAGNFYETQRLVYQGSSSSGTLLKTTSICYNTNTINCTTTAVSSPISQRNIKTILPGASNLQSQSIYKYNSAGSLIEQDDYDYGAGAPGALLKKTAITFASLGNGISAFRQSVIVTNGSGTTVSKINYNYDETAVVATSGTPQHGSVTGSRGNLTSMNIYTSGTTSLTKSMTYFDTGIVQTATDVNSASTTSVFSNSTASCGNAFPTSLNEPLSLSKSMVWNCTGSVPTSLTDENNQVSSTSFTDANFWRPASVTDPTSAVANLTFAGPTQSETALNFNGTSSTSDTLATRDSLGRPHLMQKKQAPSSTNYDTVETDYDSLGRPSRVTLPYVAAAGVANSTAPAVSTTYDALSRTLSLSDSSSGTRTYSYSQNDVYVTRGPAPTGENTKRRQEEFDALGRLTSVCEITAGTTSAPAGTCAQNSSQTGYWTKYTYDPLGRLTGVTQNAQSSNPQTRSYVYDLMGRLTSETNPESGTTTYVYDSDATCGTSNGDLVKKTDAAGNVTCTSYDSLHRPTQVSYPSGPYSSSTPIKKFVYDSATVNGVGMSNAKGRLAEAYTCTGSCSSKITDEGFSYTIRGETSDIYESTPNSGGYYHVSAQYWANGALKQIASLAGLPTITFTPDGEGRLYQVSASSGQNPVTNTVFNAASLVTSVTYGSGDGDSFTYDSNTNRLTQYQFTVNSQSVTGVLTWNANHTLASQNITDPFDSSDAQNCSYTHDDLTRLASVNCGAVWSQTFSYDAFGNLSKSGTQSFLPVYKNTSGNTTNRYVSIPGTTVSYDANGNVLSDGSHTYSMDSAGRPISVDSVNLTYDAFGRMVEQNRSGTYTQIVYGPKSLKLALMNGQTLQKGLVPLPGGGQAVYNSSGLLYYGHSDHLGSTKFGSTPSRTMYFDLAYAPFGEVYATAGTTDPAFTGERQDTVAGLFDFPAREYSTQGRWPSPDPSGLAFANLSDPQTLNRYAYVRNNPLAMVDPNGLCDVITDATGDNYAYACQLAPTDGGMMGDQGDPPASGDQGGQDTTSGGNQQNSGNDCPPDDPLCHDTAGGPVPGGLPPSLGTVATAPYPAGLVPVGTPVFIPPNEIPENPSQNGFGGGVMVTYQVVDQNGDPMPISGLKILTDSTGNEEANGLVTAGVTNSAGQFVDTSTALTGTQPGTGSLTQTYYASTDRSLLPNNPIATIQWSATSSLYGPGTALNNVTITGTGTSLNGGTFIVPRVTGSN